VTHPLFYNAQMHLFYFRFATYAGESFRYQFPRLVMPSYIISFAYCFADAATTGYSTWNEYPQEQQQLQQQQSSTTTSTTTTSTTTSYMMSRETKTVVQTLDTLLWQSLASVIIPGATINAIVRTSRMVVLRSRSPMIVAILGGTTLREWLPTIVGLGSVPLIITPIDTAVDVLLNNTTRQWFVKKQTEIENKNKK